MTAYGLPHVVYGQISFPFVAQRPQETEEGIVTFEAGAAAAARHSVAPELMGPARATGCVWCPGPFGDPKGALPGHGAGVSLDQGIEP